MEDFRLETEQVLAQLQNAIDGFRPRDEHLLADVMLFGYCRDAADALRALLILSPSDATRSAYLPARAAFEAAQDALLLIADPDRFVGPDSPATTATIDEEGKALLKALATGTITSKRKLLEALGITSPTRLDGLLARYPSLVGIESNGAGKPHVPRLTAKGRELACELGIEVHSDGGAQHDVD